MNVDTAVSFGAALWNLATWHYFPIVIILLTPVVVYFLSHQYTVKKEVQIDPETGKKKTVIDSNRKQAMLLTAATVAIPVQLWFMYLFLKILGV